MSEVLQGKVAVVTGGVSGIGRACAELFAERGATVWAADFDPVDESEQAFDKLGIRTVPCDVRNDTEVRECIDQVVNLAGRLDILVNNAGVDGVGRITEVSEEEWDRCLDTNLKGAFLFSKYAIAAMQERGGAIVNVASNAGLLPRVHDPVYCVSKAGLIMLTRSLALAHAPERIRVNAVCPGPVSDTGLMDREIDSASDPDAYRQSIIDASPLARAYGRMAEPREIAEAVAYLVSDAAQMVSGAILAIDGAKSVGVPPKID